MVYERSAELHVLVLAEDADVAQRVGVDQGRRGARPPSVMRVVTSYPFVSKKGRVIFSSDGGPQMSTRLCSLAAQASQIRFP